MLLLGFRQALVLLAPILILVLAACSEESPTGPARDPLVGTWIGSIVDPNTAETRDESFTLSVQAGGVVSATGYMWYHVGEFTVIMTLFFNGEIAPDGSLLGSGASSYILVSSTGYALMYGEGSAVGQLDAGSGEGSGYLRVVEDEGYIDLTWTAEKAER